LCPSPFGPPGVCANFFPLVLPTLLRCVRQTKGKKIQRAGCVGCLFLWLSSGKPRLFFNRFCRANSNSRTAIPAGQTPSPPAETRLFLIRFCRAHSLCVRLFFLFCAFLRLPTSYLARQAANGAKIPVVLCCRSAVWLSAWLFRRQPVLQSGRPPELLPATGSDALEAVQRVQVIQVFRRNLSC